VLKAGDLFLLPNNVPHSPRRREGSWTFVVERIRKAEEWDRFIWVCENCGNKLYETTVRFDDPSNAVANATQAMKADSKLATCNDCGEVLSL
jgi:3-hydroxyanthranilate 3,4-dioxygenase